jgi:hypothetical protein
MHSPKWLFSEDARMSIGLNKRRCCTSAGRFPTSFIPAAINLGAKHLVSSESNSHRYRFDGRFSAQLRTRWQSVQMTKESGHKPLQKAGRGKKKKRRRRSSASFDTSAEIKFLSALGVWREIVCMHHPVKNT